MIPQIKNQIQLAKTIDFDKVNYPCMGNYKYDGGRVLAFIDADTSFKRIVSCELYTRAGNRITSPEMEAEVCKLMDKYWGIGRFVLDCELIYGAGKLKDRTTINGRITSAVSATGSLGDTTDIRLMVFDFLTRQEFDDKRCLRGYNKRVIDAWGTFQFTDKVDIVEPIQIADMEEAIAMYDRLQADGYEGIVLKPANHLYTFKRSKDWARFKSAKTADLKCIGWNYGTAGKKHEHNIGSLICEGVIDRKHILVNVSGLTDHQREQHDDYEGKTIEVKYNSITQDSKTGQHSLFLPRFVCIRDDK